jgi:hypothetical protein
MNLPGYDRWKLMTPEEDSIYAHPEDPDCTCLRGRRDPWCRSHGKDPDAEYDKMRDEQMLKDWEER